MIKLSGPTRCVFSFFLLLLYDTSAHLRTMACPISFLQHCIFTAADFQFSIWNKPTAFLQTASFQLPLGFPTDVLPPKHFLITLCGIGALSIRTLWPTPFCLFRRKNVEMPHHHTFRNLLIASNSPHALGLHKLEYLSGNFHFRELGLLHGFLVNRLCFTA